MVDIPIYKVCNTGYLRGLESEEMLMATGYYWWRKAILVSPRY